MTDIHGMKPKAEKRPLGPVWLTAALARISDAVIAGDDAGVLVFMNPAAEKLTGWTEGEAVGRPLDSVVQIIAEADGRGVANPTAQTLQEAAPTGWENSRFLISRQGTKKIIEETTLPLQDDGGQNAGVLFIFREVPPAQDAKPPAPIIGHEAQSRQLMDLLPVAVYTCEAPTGIITSYNPHAVVLWGREPKCGESDERFCGSYKLWRPDGEFLPHDQTPMAVALAEGRSFHNENVIIERPDGSRIHALVNIDPIRDADGGVVGAINSFHDVSELHRVQTELEESQRRFDQIIHAMPAALYTTDSEGTINFFNEAAVELWGRRPVPGDRWCGSWRIYWPDGSPVALADCPMGIALRTGRSAHGKEIVIERPDGTRRNVLPYPEPLFDSQGAISGAVNMLVDITDRKHMELSLKFLAEASQSLSALIDYQATLGKVAHLAVPDFADWCAVDMKNRKGAVERVAIAHTDPKQIRLARDLAEKYPLNRNPRHGAMKVLDTGESDWGFSISEELLTEMARDEEHLEILRELRPTSYICVPLKTKQKILGAMTFIFAESGRHYRPDDLLVAEDLARRATIAIENALLYQEIKDAHRRKDEFLAMLAHELRNPLVPIRSGLDILALNDKEDREMIQVMQDQVEHVVRLVDDLLDVSRIIQNKIELRKETAPLSALVKQSVEAVQSLIDAHHQELLVEIPPEAIWLRVDPVRLVQVLENLLNNASKFTEDGGRIELSAAIRGEEVQIRVKDTGIGIEPELLPSVFDLFTQSNRSLDRAKGGLGIGLTLVQRLVEMHGGTVVPHSEGPGHGSTFTVRLPLAKAPSRSQKPHPEGEPEQSRRILVVDDNLGAATLLSRLLRMLGEHHVEMAHDGNSALQMVAEADPEIVLLDIGLPGKNGYQVAEAIRGRTEFDDLLLVALTGYGQKEDFEKSKQAGFDLHYVKPPSVDQMREILRHPKLNVREEKPQSGPVSRDAALAPETRPDDVHSALATAIDVPKLQHELNNVAFVLSLIEEMFSNHKHDPDILKQAGEALRNEVNRINRMIETLQMQTAGTNAS